MQYNGRTWFLNEGSPYGTMVAIATYMIQITFDHKKSMSWIVLQY